MGLRKSTQYLIVHCSATPPDMDIGADEIRKWHTEKNGWRDIGYNLVIRRSGRMEPGRGLDEVGAHTAGMNHNSFGICLIGGVDKDNKPEDNFTQAQWDSLELALIFLTQVYPEAKVRGHRDFANKACPSFPAKEWAESEGFPV